MSQVLTITDSSEFDAPIQAVWNLLMDWGAIVDWMPDGYIQKLKLEGQGEGAIRYLVTGKNVEAQIKDTIRI